MVERGARTRFSRGETFRSNGRPSRCTVKVTSVPEGESPSGTDVTLTVQREGRPLELKVSPREKRGRAPRSTT